MPGQEYRARSGQQGTWEVSFLGEHVAKRSFQKYDGEDGAAAQVLWEAWRHHTRRTGQACQVPWLVAKFDCSETGVETRQRAAVTSDSTLLAALVNRGGGRGRGRGAKVSRVSTAEPSSSSSRPAGSTAKPVAPEKKKMLKQLQNEPKVPKQAAQPKGEKKKPQQKLKKQIQQHQTLQKGTRLQQVLPVLILIQTPVLDPVLILVDEEHEGTGIPAQIRPSNPAPLLAVEFSTFFRAKTSKPQQLQQRLFPF